MSAADMRASNEAAVVSIEDAGKKAGAEAERKRLAEFNAAFPNEPAFVAECIAKEGYSVRDARADRYEATLAENIELKQKYAELTEATKEPELTFASSDTEKSQAGATVSTVDAMDAKSIKIWEKDAALQGRYNGNKAAWQAFYRNDPEGAMQSVSKK